MNDNHKLRNLMYEYAFDSMMELDIPIEVIHVLRKYMDGYPNFKKRIYRYKFKDFLLFSQKVVKFI